jgi:hypothetical protein
MRGKDPIRENPEHVVQTLRRWLSSPKLGIGKEMQ